MSSRPDVLQSCLLQAAEAADPALEQSIESAVATLQTAEIQSLKVSERDQFASAWRHLRDNKVAWCARYPPALLTAFDAAANDSPADHNATALQGPPAILGYRQSLDALQLVQDADITQAIESSRLLQHIVPRLEPTLAELDSLMSSAQGWLNVRPERNPLRPEVFTSVLQTLMAASQADPALLALCIKHLAHPLAAAIQCIYVQTITRLEQAQVQAVHYRVRQAPQVAAAAAVQKPQRKSGTAVPAYLEGAYPEAQLMARPRPHEDFSDPDIRDALLPDFVFHGGGKASEQLTSTYYASVEEELAALKAAPDSSAAPLTEPVQPVQSERASEDQATHASLAAVDRPQRQVDVSSPLNATLWGSYARSRERTMLRTQLKTEATQLGQVLGLELVPKLVNQVAQDPRLLAPVREAIVALEPSLLRLALVDPRFLSGEDHPGRRLMERVAQRSFKYNDEFSPEFTAFFQVVRSAFNALNAVAVTDATPFAMALAQLEYAWDEQDQLEVARRNQVLQALRFAEQRQEQANQMAYDLSERSDLDKVPGVVLDFLLGPWSLVMAHARLTDQSRQIDPHGFCAVVSDLVWSVKRDVTIKRPAKLIAMIPTLLDKLHAGLEMLGQDPKESQPFFESLMQLHQPVLKLRRIKSRRDAQDPVAEPLHEETHEALAPRLGRMHALAAAQPWLGRGELDAAGFADTQQTAPGELATNFDSTPEPRTPATGEDGHNDPIHDPMNDPAHAATVQPAGYTQQQAETILDQIKTGDWVDLYSKRRWLRAQLIWASSRATLFMFLSHGSQPHSMTRRSCEKLIMQRWLRPVESHGVVARALDAVVSEIASPLPASATPAKPRVLTHALTA